jgi:hypothetical protein
MNQRFLKTFCILTAFGVMFLISVLFSGTSSANNTTYYVNNLSGSNCSDSGSGTLTQPWCSFTPINNHGAFSPGDQILLARGGSWNQQMSLSGSGTSTGWITVDAYGTGNLPIITRNDGLDDRGIKLTNGDYWRFKNLEVSHAAAGIMAFYNTLGHNGLFFDNIYVHHITGIGAGRDNTNGNPVTSATNDHLWSSSGIVVTGNLPSFTTSDYAIRDIRMNNITGHNNFDTISFDFLFPYSEQISNNIGGSGGDGHNLAQNIVINHVYSHDDDNICSEALRFFAVKHVVVMNTILDNETPCYNPSGTTAVIIGHAKDITFVNSIVKNLKNTGSNDEAAFDLEILNDTVRIRNSFMGNTPGSAIGFLQFRNPDHSINHEVSSNLMVNNAYAHYGNSAFNMYSTVSSPITGTINDNFTTNQNYYNVQAGNFNSFTRTNNQFVPKGSGEMYFAAEQFSGTQGKDNWSYQYYNGSSYANLSYNSTNKSWTPTGQATPEITQFDQHPDTNTSNWTARAWTAPESGIVSLRGRILKSDNTTGGDGVLARITKNGTVIWPTSGGSQHVAAGDEYTGVNYVIDNLSVTAGDILRFEVNTYSTNNYDKTSWTPAIVYTSNYNEAYNWGFMAGLEGWTGNQVTVSTATGSTDAGSLNFTSTGTDPYLYSPDNLNVDTSIYKKIKIRMTNGTSNTIGKVYFITNADTTWNEAKSVEFTPTANSGYTEYTLDMGANSNWVGTIRKLRYDPVQETGSIKTDYIKLVTNTLYGFELPSTSDYTSGPMTNGWTFEAYSGVQHNGSSFGVANAPEGVQTAFLQRDGSFSQSFNFTAGSHTISFQAAKRTTYGGTQSFDVLYDSTVIGSFTPSSGSFSSFTTNSFTATAGSHTIKFVGTTTGDNTDFIDAVIIN